MKKFTYALLLPLLYMMGCAHVETVRYDANGGITKEKGVASYAPVPHLLVVSTGETDKPLLSQIVYLPDKTDISYTRYYQGLFGTANYSLTLDGGVLTTINSAIDTKGTETLEKIASAVTGGIGALAAAGAAGEAKSDAESGKPEEMDAALATLASLISPPVLAGLAAPAPPTPNSPNWFENEYLGLKKALDASRAIKEQKAVLGALYSAHEAFVRNMEPATPLSDSDLPVATSILEVAKTLPEAEFTKTGHVRLAEGRILQIKAAITKTHGDVDNGKDAIRNLATALKLTKGLIALLEPSAGHAYVQLWKIDPARGIAIRVVPQPPQGENAQEVLLDKVLDALTKPSAAAAILPGKES